MKALLLEALRMLGVLVCMAAMVLAAFLLAGGGGAADATARPHMPDATCPEGSHGR